MEVKSIIAYCLFAAAGLMICSRIRSWRLSKKSAPLAKAGPSATTTAGATGSTISATTPSPIPSPPPVPVAAPQKTNWGWLVVVGILVAIILFWIVVPALKSTAPPPQVTTPKRELQRHVVKIPLEINYQDGKQIIFCSGGVPWQENARYQVAFHLVQDKPGKLFIEINGGKGGDGPFNFKSWITGQEITVVFFEPTPGGFQGNPKYFVPGTNWIKFYSSGCNVEIRHAQIEVEYWS